MRMTFYVTTKHGTEDHITKVNDAEITGSGDLIVRTEGGEVHGYAQGVWERYTALDAENG